KGSLRDYVTCKECHAESSRLDHFLDISLVLRPFGSDKARKLRRSAERAEGCRSRGVG
ncbi:unnamed protein product, partial [Hapterophycus canaliculatus]